MPCWRPLSPLLARPCLLILANVLALSVLLILRSECSRGRLAHFVIWCFAVDRGLLAARGTASA
eukprot:2898696-Pyramimonas_sp.AAC.1